jgi:succinate dehydrogenase/fumarate reductase flavoprotein subunit
MSVDERCDVLVIGAGAAGLTAAAVAAAEGRRVLLLECSPFVGGTTAISGGMVWVPANHKMAAAGRPDSVDAARAYLAHTVPADDDRAPLDTFIREGDAAIRYLEAKTALRLRPVMSYPDYYPDLPGATPGGRVLEPMPFDARTLGPSFALLRAPLPEFLLFGGMMVHRSDIPHLRRAVRSPKAAWYVAKLLWRHARERLHAPRGTTLHLGNALAGWLFKSAIDLGVDVRTGVTVRRLIVEKGRVAGAETERTGQAGATLIAARAVILASGGCSHDAALRRRYLPAGATLSATVAPGAQRSGADLALEVGAQVSRGTTRRALWVPASSFTRHDGSTGVYPHTVTDRGKPGLIAVDGRGLRFVNESLSYHEFVQAQLRSEAVPAFLVCDRTFLWKYGLGCVRPFASGRTLAAHLRSGALKRGHALDDLARAIGVPATALQGTVASFNADARRGIDALFGRGGDIYQRHLGDAEQRPNPCVAPIDDAPFYAMAVRPADLGMAAGLVTDASARVLDAGGAPVPGLYACGNDMQSVMNGAYPGPGITLGPALVFGVIASRHAVAH